MTTAENCSAIFILWCFVCNSDVYELLSFRQVVYFWKIVFLANFVPMMQILHGLMLLLLWNQRWTLGNHVLQSSLDPCGPKGNQIKLPNIIPELSTKQKFTVKLFGCKMVALYCSSLASLNFTNCMVNFHIAPMSVQHPSLLSQFWSKSAEILYTDSSYRCLCKQLADLA